MYKLYKEKIVYEVIYLYEDKYTLEEVKEHIASGNAIEITQEVVYNDVFSSVGFLTEKEATEFIENHSAYNNPKLLLVKASVIEKE